MMSVAGDDARFEEEITRVSSALRDVLHAPDAHGALEALLRYLAATHRRLRVEEIGEILERAAGPEGREIIVTFLDEIELRGELKGLEKGHTRGRAEGRAEMLLEQLTARFGALPASVRARVEAADEATMARWAVRVLTATTLAEVMARPGKAPPARKPGARARSPRG